MVDLTEADANRTAVVRELEGVRQQIGEDLLHQVGVEEVAEIEVRYIELEVDGPAFRQRSESLDDALQKLPQIVFPDPRLHLTGFETRYVQHLIDEPQQAP